MKVKIRTKAGEFINDLHHITTKWLEIDERELRGEYIDHPNIEVMVDGKNVPTPEPGPTSLPRRTAEVVAEPVVEVISEAPEGPGG